jgi:hypothetical protein
VKKRIGAHLLWLEKELARTERDLDEAIEESPVSGGRTKSCFAACRAWGPS